MKKRVRIYKAGGQSDAVSQEDIYKYIADTMSAEDYDGDTDAISEKLAQAGIDSDTADAYIDEVDTYLKENNSEEVTDDSEITPEEQAAAEAEQAALEEQNAAEEEARQAQLYAMYNTDTEEGVPDDNADEEIISRYGGAKPSKRSFINQYIKLAKKAEGGNTPSPGADDVLGAREDRVTDFFKGIGQSVNLAQQKQAAEEQYNAIYGNPQVGKFEDGGINQEQVDFENPLHHLSTYGADTRHIFSDNMYTQNDIAALEQYGGNTGQGLYKFIGGGDNELMDEQYQDSDLDYQRYARHGGSLHKYVDEGEVTEASLVSPIDGHTYSDEEIAANKEQTDKTADTEDYKKKYDELVAQNTTATTAAQKEQQMMQQYMMQQYMMQMGQGMFRSPIISRGEQYNKAVGSPYYTESGEKYTGPDLAGRLPSSVNVDKYGIFGRPKKMTYNYGSNEYLSPTGSSESLSKNEELEDAPYRGKTLGERLGRGMVNTKIPGIQQLGAKLIPSGIGYEGPNVTDESNKFETNNLINRFREKYPKFNDFGQGDSNASNVNPIAPGINPTVNEPYYPPISPKAQRRENRNDKKTNREYGGPVDYTEYAYGGDVSIPELYRAQTGVEMPEDYSSLNFVAPELKDDENFPDPTDPTEPAAKPLTKEQELLKYQRGYNQQLTYVDPKVAGENISGIGTTDNPVMQQGVSQKFRNKQAWDISKKGIGNASLLIGNAFKNTADEVTANKQENQLLENLTAAETNFGINNGYNKGDYDPNSGLFRPDQMGAMQSKYGGGVYAMGGNTEDEDEDIQYMTQEEIDEFRANGGELEYL